MRGLRLADGYIIPTIPDVLSTYGIPQIVNRVSEFAREVNQRIDMYGIVVCKYREQSTMHRRTLESLRRGPEHVFETVIPEANAIAASAEYLELATLRQKYSYGNRYDLFSQLTREVLEASQL
jgi:chromosome partitioning protein